jgi:alanine racemase
MRGDTDMIADLNLAPILNTIDQINRHFEALPDHSFGLQLDTGKSPWSGMGGTTEPPWRTLRRKPVADMSHLACADSEPDHPMNPYQLDIFHQMTVGSPRRAAAATGESCWDRIITLLNAAPASASAACRSRMRPSCALTCQSSSCAT